MFTVEEQQVQQFAWDEPLRKDGRELLVLFDFVSPELEHLALRPLLIDLDEAYLSQTYVARLRNKSDSRSANISVEYVLRLNL